MAKQKINPIQINNPYMFKAERITSTQSIGDNTYTTVVFNSASIDPSNGFNTSTGEYTIPRTGYYQINAAVEVQGPNSGTGTANSIWTTAIKLIVNGSTVVQRFGHASFDQSRFQMGTVTISDVFLLTAGDVIKIQALGDPNGGGDAIVAVTINATTFSGFLVST